LPILIFVVILLCLGYWWLSRSKKTSNGNWIQFFAKGKDAGFSFKEIEKLRLIAVQCDLEDPCSLFSSRSLLDKCIFIMVQRLKMSGESEERETQDFLSRVYEYRQHMEVSEPDAESTISSSRKISEGQVLRIFINKKGIYKSYVVKNTSQYMTISRPVNSNLPSVSPWAGTRFSVYFWRMDDAGYVFESEALDEVFSMGISSLKISHSDTLMRTQKRKSLRVKMHKPAYLYLATEDEPPHELERQPGLKCYVEDLSDTGCAIVVGGKAETDIRVKVQFALDEIVICMTGIVRSINFDESTGRSLLHIEAEPIPIDMRNIIFGEVFGMSLENDSEDLPFGVVNAGSPGTSSTDGDLSVFGTNSSGGTAVQDNGDF
jgi:c-di-GMP-binding flagellar brake protein YcgR